jgi:glycosyltransferase involved in cell wall biosynthesis
MPKPLVSVVIPAYNAERTICNALKTVSEQSYRPIEVVVVDDGSIDGTSKEVLNYISRLNYINQMYPLEMIEPISNYRSNTITLDKDSFSIKYLYQTNSGPSKARNVGVTAASGEFIAFLDADDLWMNSKIEKQIELFSAELWLDIVFTDARVRRFKDAELNDFSLFNKFSLDEKFFGHSIVLINPIEKLLERNFITTPSVMARRECFKGDMKFNEKRRFMEDWELFLKWSLCFNFGYLREELVHVVDEADGLHSNYQSMSVSKCDVLDDFMTRHGREVSSRVATKILSKIIKEHYKWGGYFFMQIGKNSRARHFFRRSLQEAFDIKIYLYILKSVFMSICHYRRKNKCANWVNIGGEGADS